MPAFAEGRVAFKVGPTALALAVIVAVGRPKAIRHAALSPASCAANAAVVVPTALTQGRFVKRAMRGSATARVHVAKAEALGQT